MKFKYYLNKSVKTTVQPKTKDELKYIIEDTIEDYGYHCDLNFIDTSEITDMSYLFCVSEFNGNISKWDVSNVIDMEWMFKESKFNRDISNWDVSNVENMKGMFRNSKFAGDISDWDVRHVKYAEDMFDNCPLENKPEFQPKKD